MKRFYVQTFDGLECGDIDENTFAGLRSAKLNLLQSMSAEEKFDVVMENYVELEKAIFEVALDHLAFNHLSSFGPIRRLIDRRLMSFFSSCRLYRHSIVGNLRKITRQRSDEKLLLSYIEDSDAVPMEYRIIECVRNFAQHQELVVSGFWLGSEWAIEGGRKTRAAYSAVPSFSTRDICKTRELPDAVRQALMEFGPRVHIMPLLRKSLEHYGLIHKVFREIIESRCQESAHLVESEIASRVDSTDGFPKFLNAILEVDGKLVENFQLFPELVADIKQLQTKNRSQVNLSKRYVRWADELAT